jgi:hypothetical protein
MQKSSAAATRDSHGNLYIPVYKEIHTITPDNGSGGKGGGKGVGGKGVEAF